LKAKKFVDRLMTVQKEVQESVTELDRARFAYHTEESECIKTAERAEEAELKAKGKKKDMMSMFKSQTALEQQAEKLIAKQEELNIKSTGARNEYLLAIQTANAHQTQYYQTWLKKCLAGTECGVYVAVSEYISILSTTELATCSAQNSSLNGIKEICCSVSKHGSMTTSEQMVQYNYEPVQGDQVSTVLIPEQDAGINYALTREAKDAAEKYNNAIKRISAFTKRKGALSKAMKSGQNVAELEEKIEEFEHSLNIAETEKAKAVAKLDILREGGLPVDSYMDEEKPQDYGGNAAHDWDYHDDHDSDQVTEVNYYSYDQISYGDSQQGAAPPQPAPVSADPWPQDEDPWGSSSPAQEQPPAPEPVMEEYTGEVAQAVVLYTFDATSHDELSVREGEWINLLLSGCQEEGWVMGQNSDGQSGLIPASFVTQTTPEEYLGQLTEAAAAVTAGPDPIEPAWGQTDPAPAAPDLSIPMCPPPAAADEDEETSSEEESEEDSDDGGPPPGLAPPPGPPPTLSPPGPPPQPPTSPLSSVMGSYQVIYDFQASADDELSINVGDVVIVKRPGDDEGWFYGSLKGKEGIFPSSYVEPYNGTPKSPPKSDDEIDQDNSSNCSDESEAEDDKSAQEPPPPSTLPEKTESKCSTPEINATEKEEENKKLIIKSPDEEKVLNKDGPKQTLSKDNKETDETNKVTSEASNSKTNVRDSSDEDNSSATESDDDDSDKDGDLK